MRLSEKWGRLELFAWCALALLFALTFQAPVAKLPHITPDSTQYLNAAQHLRSDHRMETSLVHFDTERSHGVIPAPLTWFPPGYPAAIALISPLAGSYESAALAVSLISFALVTGGLWYLMVLLDPSVWLARAAALCWMANSQALFASSAALSESLFTLLGLASLLFLVRGGAWSWTGAAVMAALSYWVRYAGTLWIGAFVVVAVVELVLRKRVLQKEDRPSWRTLVGAAGLLVLLVAPLMLRNVLLVGDWRGGNNTHFSAPIRTFLVNTPKLWYHLTIGEAALRHIWIPVALVLVGLIGVCVLGVSKAANPTPALPLVRVRVLFTVALVYCGGIAAIALRSVISYAPRMYVPVLPHLIALAVLGIALLIRRLSRPHVAYIMIGCTLAGYVAANIVSCLDQPADDIRRTAQALRTPGENGTSIQDRLSRDLASGEVIASTDGQVAGYILGHPTLSLVGRPYSTLNWNEGLVQNEMARYHAKYLLVFRDPTFDPVIQDSSFLASLTGCNAAARLKLVTKNPEICVYQLR